MPDSNAAASVRAAIPPHINRDDDSPFEPPCFYFPQNNSSIIIAIDAQKPWENVESYGDRVIALLAQRGMSEARDPIFMCRVFLGGLRPAILREILLLHVEPHLLYFRRVFYFAHYLENSVNVAMRVMSLGGNVPPKWKDVVKPGRASVVVEGLEFFGETNKAVDAYYQCGPVKSQLKVLYRH